MGDKYIIMVIAVIGNCCNVNCDNTAQVPSIYDI